jgi:aryl-alcohol dehydrogenase-like predicted oxidoreductase
MRNSPSLKSNKKSMTLGGAQFGMDYGITNTNGQVSLKNAEEIIRQAITDGIEYIDTAAAYGDSEKVIGKALIGDWSHRVKIISKMSPFIDMTDEQSNVKEMQLRVRNSVLASCINLNASSINTIMLHRANHLHNELIMKELLALRREGIIKNIGVSIQNSHELGHALSTDNISIIQMPFNIIDFRWDNMIAAVHAAKKKRELLIHARSSLLQGLLCSSDNEKWEKANILNHQEIILWLNKKYKQYGKMSVADLCIGFVNSQDWIDSVVIGIDSMKNLFLNLQSISEPIMSAHEISDILATRPMVDVVSLNPSNWK